ncbi:translocation protein TolB [Chitinispirillum alkaliphilum]|nr:translocation protein TolB [Chitinispirillum alkaliphilum]
MFSFLFLIPTSPQSSIQEWWTDLYGKNSGNTTAAFLSIPSSASQLSRGLVSSSGSMCATDLPFFPANSALTFQNQFAISHLEWLMGLRKEYAGATFPLLDVGTFGFYFRFLSSGQFKYARDIDENPSDPKYFEYVLGASFARPFFNRKLSFGVNASYVESRLDIDAGRAFSAGADLLVKPFDMLSGRIYLLNAGTPMSYGGGRSHPLPIQTGASINFHPFRGEEDSSPMFDLEIGAGIQKTADEPVVLGISSELRAGPSIFLRSGYEHSAGNKVSINGLSAGVGFRGEKYGFDAGWKLQSGDFGLVWAADIFLHLDEIQPRTADEYYKIALYHFDNGRNRLARHNATKALRAEPNHWHTHTLLSRMRSEALRRENLEIGLIYSGNLQGRFVPMPPSADALGGISRQGALVNNLRSAYRTAFSLDVGNIVNESTHPLRVQLAKEYYTHMGFDIIAPGRGELLFLGEIFSERDLTGKSDIVLSNSHIPLPSEMVKQSIIEKNGYQIFAVNILGETVTYSNNIESVKEHISALLSSPQALRSDLRIAVIHDTWENITEIARAAPQLDIIICANLNQRFESPMRVGSTIILSAGSEGRFVGALSLRFNRERELISTEHRLYPVLGSIEPDSVLEQMKNQVTATIELEKAGIDIHSQQSARGIVPFVTDRNGAPQAFLKTMEKLAELPLTPYSLNSFSPEISFETGKALYLTGCRELMNVRLEVLKLKNFRRREVVKGKNVLEARFSGDGKWIYFSAADSGSQVGSIYKTPASLSEETVPVIKNDSSSQHSFSFSPDGELLVYISDEYGHKQIFLTNTTGTAPRRLTDFNANFFAPAFSPDGRYIAYISDRFSIGQRRDLWVYDRESSEHVQITTNSYVEDFCWTNDSRTIIFSSGVNFLDLNMVDIKEHRFRKLITTTGLKNWHETNPRFLYFNQRPRIVYNRKTEDGTSTVRWVDLLSGRDERIINSEGNDWLE